MENIKIKIPNQEINRKVQEKAFELGYYWSGFGREFSYPNIVYLFLYDSGHITFYADYDSDYFNAHRNAEVTWEDFLYKDVDIYNCKINLQSYNSEQLDKLKIILRNNGICPYRNSMLINSIWGDAPNYMYIKEGKTVMVGTEFYYNLLDLPELSVDYILKNYKEKEMEVLPEKWCIKVTEENKPFFQTLCNCEIGFGEWYDYSINTYYGPIRDKEGFKGAKEIRDRTEITFDQFKRLVLKQDTQQNMNEITLKCIKIPSKAKNIKEGGNYQGIYIDEEETQVDTYDEAVYFLCQNDRGAQARYNIDLFEKPEVIKKTIDLDNLSEYLNFGEQFIQFISDEYNRCICANNGAGLLKSSPSQNSCGIYLIGGQTSQGVDELHRLIFVKIDDIYRELSEIYNLMFDRDSFGEFIFKKYIDYKLSTIDAAFKIISTHMGSPVVSLLDSMECIKTDGFLNPNSGNYIKIWIFTNDNNTEEEEEEDEEEGIF